MTKTVTIPLEYPIDEVKGEKLSPPITELTFRRMRAGDALVADGEENKVMAGYRLFAALAGVEVEVIEAIDMEDFAVVSERVAPLMGKSMAQAVKEASGGAGAT